MDTHPAVCHRYEPADIEGVNATTVLVGRVKQGVAEWCRLQLKEKIWKGLVEHSLDRWNIGTPAYGFLAERIAHPVPFKAAQGRTNPGSSGPGARPSDRADAYLAHRGQAGLPGDCRPAQRRPGRLPAAECGHRVDRAERPGHPRKSEVHRAHGLRSAHHPQRPPRPQPARPVAVDPRPPFTRPSWTGPPGTPPRTPPLPTAPAATAMSPIPTRPPAGPTRTGPGYAAGTAAAG